MATTRAPSGERFGLAIAAWLPDFVQDLPLAVEHGDLLKPWHRGRGHHESLSVAADA